MTGSQAPSSARSVSITETSQVLAPLRRFERTDRLARREVERKIAATTAGVVT